MQTTLPIIAALAVVFFVGCQSSGQDSPTGRDSKANLMKSDSTNRPLSVLMMHVGPERKPIWPLIWYADESGLKLATDKIPTTHRDYAKKEKVTGSFLENLYTETKPKRSTSADRPFGSTELTFLYASPSPQSFILNRDDLKAVCEKFQGEVPKQSYIGDYFVRIGVSQFK